MGSGAISNPPSQPFVAATPARARDKFRVVESDFRTPVPTFFAASLNEGSRDARVIRFTLGGIKRVCGWCGYLFVALREAQTSDIRYRDPS